jgi:hypothetical protein
MRTSPPRRSTTAPSASIVTRRSRARLWLASRRAC